MKSPLSVLAMHEIIDGNREHFKPVGLAIGKLVKQTAKERGTDVERMLSRVPKVRGWYRDDLKTGTGEIRNFARLFRILQLLEVDTNWLFRLALVEEKPWSQLSPEKNCVVYVGEHSTVQQGWTPETQQMVSKYDVKSFELFSDIFDKQTGVKRELRKPLLKTVSRTAKPTESSLATLGMIVAIGGLGVNPLAGSLFKNQTSAPITFALPERMSWHNDPPCFSVRNGLRNPQMEFKGDVYPVMEKKGSKYVDYGILTIDCSAAAVRILCAGTGGVGTIACVSALKQVISVSNVLTKSETQKVVFLVRGSSPANDHLEVEAEIIGAFEYNSGEELSLCENSE